MLGTLGTTAAWMLLASCAIDEEPGDATARTDGRVDARADARGADGSSMDGANSTFDASPIDSDSAVEMDTPDPSQDVPEATMDQGMVVMGVDVPNAMMGVDSGVRADVPNPPMCAPAMPACRPAPAVRENAGLLRDDHCAYRLVDRDRWAAEGALADQFRMMLGSADVPTVVADGNRMATEINALARVPSFAQGFRWNAGDEAADFWYPQGITGSADHIANGLVNGRNVLIVSWYDRTAGAANRGVRVSFVDITNPRAVVYRHVLLVHLTAGAPRITMDIEPVHAGGLVWYGHYLYVPVTGRGFDVFDLDRMARVPGRSDVIGWDAGANQYSAGGYAYVLPRVGEYALSNSCPISFSFVSLDRSSSPPSLVTGEYVVDAANGRLARWSLDPATGRLAGSPVIATDAYYSQQTRMQGALSFNGNWYLSCSSQVGSNGAIYRANDRGPSREFTQPPGVEDLYYERPRGLLWGLTEQPNERNVFAAPLTAY